MSSTGLIPTPPSEDIPIPKAQEVTPQPNIYPQQQLPQGAGFAGTTGQVANIAGNFLQGWMLGKHAAEVKKSQQAIQQVQYAKSGLDISGNYLGGLLKSGPPTQDQNAPEYKSWQAEVTKAKQAVSSARDNFVNTMTPYVVPTDPKTGQPIKPGIGGKMKSAFVPQGPQLMTQAALETYKSLPLEAFAPQQTAQDRKAQFDLGEERKAAADVDKSRGLRDSYNAKLQEFYKLQQDSGADPAKMASMDRELKGMEGQLGTYGIKVDRKSMEEEALEKMLAHNKTLAYSDLAAGKKLMDLPQNEQIALGYTPGSNMLEGYLQQVGPGKKYASDLEAIQAHDRFEADQQIRVHTSYAGAAQNAQMAMYKKIAGAELRQQGIQNPTEDQILAHMGGMLKPSQDAKEFADPKKVQAIRDSVMAQVVAENPDYKEILSTTDKSGKAHIGFNASGAPAPRPIIGMLPFTDTDKERNSAYQDKVRAAKQALRDKASALGYDELQIGQLFGPPDAPLATTNPDAKPTDGAKPGMVPPVGLPGANPPNAAQRTFSVSKWKAANPGGDVEAAKAAAAAQNANIID